MIHPGTASARGAACQRLSPLRGLPGALLGPLLGALMLVAPISVSEAAAQQQREVRRTFAAADGMRVEVENLAGRFRIGGSDGGEIEIVATLHAEGGEAAALLDSIGVDFSTSGSRIVVEPLYPVDRYRAYRYPEMSRRTRTQTTFRGERVRVESGGDGLALWIDFVVRLPAGVGATIENHVGDVSASDVRGPLSIDTGSGNVNATGNVGTLTADTGSGEVTVREHEGRVTADTGSGRVVIESVRGDVTADTGSGEIEIRNVEAERIEADTGSGDVYLEQVAGSLIADTGSGDIEARDLRAGARLWADTGSGDVLLSGDLSGVDEIEIDTGSGNVTLETTSVPPMRLRIETGNGGIDVDLPDLRVLSRSRYSLNAEVGDGGARVSISTGSGSVRVRRR